MKKQVEVSRNHEPINRRRKVPVRTKLLFAFGTLHEATVTAAGLVTVLFYNQVLGVSPVLCGTAFLIASIIDAISDPLVGAVSDRFSSRWGRRHPFMIAAALPIAIAFFCLYQPPEGLNEISYFAWLTTFLVLLRLGQTFYLIPHDAFGAELTDDYEERTSIFGYNAVMQTVLSTVTVGILYYVILPTTPEYENGLLNQPRYIFMAAFGALTLVFSVLVCALGTLDQIPYLHRVDVSKKFNFGNYLGSLKMLVRNRSYVSACLSLLTMYAGLGVIAVVASYAYIYVFELNSEQMIWAGIAKVPGALTALPLLWLLSKRMEKKPILIMATAVTSVLVSLPYILKMMGYFPANDSPFLLYALFVPMFIAFMIFPLAPIIIDSQLSDIADEHEYISGERSEGIIFSIRSFGYKATQGIGGFIAGFGLQFIGFPESAEVGGLAPDTINGLLVLNGPLYLGFYLLAIFFMTRYSINRKRHAAILDALASRRKMAHENKTHADEGSASKSLVAPTASI